MNDTIKKAIHTHLVVELNYRDEGERLIDIQHAAVNKEGATYLVCWQVEGHSETGHLPGWRYFDVDGITTIRVLNTKFKPRTSDKALEDLLSKHQLEVLKLDLISSLPFC